MKHVGILAFATIVGAFTTPSFAQLTPQHRCDFKRLSAWQRHTNCVMSVLKQNTKSLSTDDFAALAKCRRKYFRVWSGFQANTSLSGSACVGARFIDNGNQTVTDNLTSLVWENRSETSFSWSADPAHIENGTVFTTFLAGLNTGFGGANGWRLPNIVELQTIIADYPCRGGGFTPTCRCSVKPCVDPIFKGQILSTIYWSSTSLLRMESYAWTMSLENSDPYPHPKTYVGPIGIAVRAGF